MSARHKLSVNATLHLHCDSKGPEVWLRKEVCDNVTCDSQVIGEKLTPPFDFFIENVTLTYKTSLQFETSGSSSNLTLCDVRPTDLMAEDGKYNILLYQDSLGFKCQFTPDYPNWIPILYAMVFYANLFGILHLIGLCCNFLSDRYQPINRIITSATASSSSGVPLDPVVSDVVEDIRTRARRRITTLDALRGLIVVLMVFVNFEGGGYSFFECTSCLQRNDTEHGLNIADVISPAFAFIMGFSIVLSVKTQLMLEQGYLLLVCNVIRRSCLLFIIGLFLNASVTQTDRVETTYHFILGMQMDLLRLSLAHLVVGVSHLATIYLFIKYKDSTGWRALLVFLPEFSVQVVVLILHIFRSSQFVDKIKEDKSCWADEALINGVQFTSEDLCSRETFPEFMLGFTGSILLAEIGLICGRIFLPSRPYHKRMIILSIVALSCMPIALPLMHPTIAIDKNSWSIPFILISSALTIVAFILLYLVIEVLEIWTNGFPFHYAGRNALLIYIGHKILRPYFPFSSQLWNDQNHNTQMTRSLVASNLWLVLAAYFYYQEQFFTFSGTEN